MNLSVTSRPEMSGTHFFGYALLRGMPRTPVGGERLGKHGALSDGPSAPLLFPALPPGPFRSAAPCDALANCERRTKSGAFESDAHGAVSLSF